MNGIVSSGKLKRACWGWFRVSFRQMTHETFAQVGGESRQVVRGREWIATSTDCVYYFVGPDLREQETKNKKQKKTKNKKEQTEKPSLKQKTKQEKRQKIKRSQEDKKKKQNKTKNKTEQIRKVRNKKQNKTEKRQNNGKKRGRFLVPGQAVQISFQSFGHFYLILPAEPCTRVSPFFFRELVYPWIDLDSFPHIHSSPLCIQSSLSSTHMDSLFILQLISSL